VESAVIPTTSEPPIVLPCGCVFPGRTIPGGAVGDYAGNHGDLSPGSNNSPTDFYWGGNGTGLIISSRGVCQGSRPVNWIDRVRVADVRDGASNTLLVGEMHIRRGELAQAPGNGPMYNGVRFFTMSRVGGVGVPLARDLDDDVLGLGVYAFGSWHPGICQFAFADGRVIPVRTDINTNVLASLCHRADGRVIPEF
jgi:hypothetical protein